MICLVKFNININAYFYISNRFVIACNIQLVIRMLYNSFQDTTAVEFFYLMVKSGKSFVKLDLSFQRVNIGDIIKRNFYVLSFP